MRAIQPASIAKRLLVWLAVALFFAAFVLGLAGRTDLPMVNAFLAICILLALAMALTMDAELARRRLDRRQHGEDSARLALIRASVLATFVVALLDVGRFHWSDTVPRPLQVAALAFSALTLTWTLWAVRSNRFFVPVIRIQPELGHRVVSSGPYAWMRHPGYVGLVLGAPSYPLALGSWLGLAPAVLVSVLFLLRTAHEDRFLRVNLEGYEDYARRVRFRLLPGLW